MTDNNPEVLARAAEADRAASHAVLAVCNNIAATILASGAPEGGANDADAKIERIWEKIEQERARAQRGLDEARTALRPSPIRDAVADAEGVAELRTKLRQVIAHATGGHMTDGADLGLNDICVEISRHRNWIWEHGRANALRTANTGRAEVLDVRPEVAAFALLMERELRANDHKPGWKNCGPDALCDRVLDEARELAEAVAGYGLSCSYEWNFEGTATEKTYRASMAELRDNLGAEAADVANMAMMVADVCGALSSPPVTTAPDEGIAPAVPDEAEASQEDDLASCERALARRTEERNRFAEMLRQAAADLRTVGDDYPGSSCQKWCHERANAALGLPPPTNCEDCEGRGYYPANPANNLYSDCPTCNGTGRTPPAGEDAGEAGK